jgi:hypothetical protein
MKQLSFLFMAALLAGVLLTVPASAAIITINGTDFTNGQNNQLIGTLVWTSSAGNFQPGLSKLALGAVGGGRSGRVSLFG